MNRVLPVQIRVAGLLVSEGAILLESFADREVWGVPGGSLEPGETLEEGCRREFREELGLAVNCESMALVMENRFRWHEQDKFELGFYFRVSPVTPFAVPRPELRSLEPKLQFRWFPLVDLTRLNFLPSSLPARIQSSEVSGTVFFSSRG